MRIKNYVWIVLAGMASRATACSDFKVGCCNIIGGNCDGPCWNAGCATVCTGSTPTACLNSGGDLYDCCPAGSQCRSSCDARSTSCCCDPNDQQIISISNVQYDLNNISEETDPSAIRTAITNKGENYGPAVAAAPSLNVRLSSTQTTSWSFTSTTKISASATFKAGLPFVTSGKVTLGLEEDLAYGTSGSTTQQLDITINTGQDYIQPYSRQVWEFSSDMKIFHIPFTAQATVQDDCGTTSQKPITGTAQVSGVAAIIEGAYTKIAGPSVPVECKSPFDTPVEQQSQVQWCPSGTSSQCSDHVLCLREGLTSGTCCAPGQLDGCCAMAAAHTPSCDSHAAQDVICPSPSGVFDPCCSPSLPHRRLSNSTEPLFKFESAVVHPGQGSTIRPQLPSLSAPVHLKAFQSNSVVKPDAHRKLR